MVTDLTTPAAAERTSRERAAQGLPATVEDRLALARLAVTIRRSIQQVAA